MAEKATSEQLDRLWTLDEVCAYLRIEASEYNGRHAAVTRLKIPSVHIGSRLRFIPSEVRRWAASQNRS